MNQAVFIITTYGSKEEHKLTKQFFDWALSDEVIKKLAEYELKPHLLPMTNYTAPGQYGKGLAIRKALKDLAGHQGTIGSDDIIIYMDGNQIDYNNSFHMIHFIKKLEKPFVTSCRINGMGIDEERGSIERFENYLLSKKYGLPWIPDAQCGCWAFRGDYFEEINKTFESETFEIELEVMNFFLSKGIYPAFIGMDVGKPGNTSFKPHHSQPKIIKLSNWLKLNRKKLEVYAEEFQKKFKQTLPIKYLYMFQDSDIYSDLSKDEIKPWEQWQGIVCTHYGKCNNGCEAILNHPCHSSFDYDKHHIQNF